MRRQRSALGILLANIVPTYCCVFNDPHKKTGNQKKAGFFLKPVLKTAYRLLINIMDDVFPPSPMAHRQRLVQVCVHVERVLVLPTFLLRLWLLAV